MDYQIYYTNTGNPIDFPPTELQRLVKTFFEDYLNIREESDSGRVFAPIQITCCRAHLLEPLNDLLDRMQQLCGAEAPVD